MFFDALYGKTQVIRIADVVFVGPVMIAGGAALVSRKPLLGYTLAMLGIATIAYNAHNWWVLRER